MKGLVWGILAMLMCCGLVALQAGAADVPRAMEGVDLTSAREVSLEEGAAIRGQLPIRYECTWWVWKFTSDKKQNIFPPYNYNRDAGRPLVGNAKDWNNNVANGTWNRTFKGKYGLSCTPVNNCIMVWEDLHPKYGHVALVTKADKISNAYNGDWRWNLYLKQGNLNGDKKENVGKNATFRHDRASHDRRGGHSVDYVGNAKFGLNQNVTKKDPKVGMFITKWPGRK